MKILELFSGYGTSSFALKQLGIPYELIGYSDIDKYANQCFKQNHCPEDVEDKLRLGDVRLINPNELPDFDLLTGGFPCQPFSVAGKRKGESDIRGTLFYEIIRIAEIKKPKYMLLENVKGLTNKTFKETFDKILSELDRIGYNVYWKVINTKDFGIPQSRARVWFVCFRKDIDKGIFQFPEQFPLTIFIKDILEEIVDSKYYLSEKLQERFSKYLEDKNKKLGNEEPAILDLYNNKVKEDGTSITLSDPCHNNLRLIEGDVEVHSLFPRSGNPNDGGTGHLSKEDGTSYAVDTGNCQAVLLGYSRDSKGETINLHEKDISNTIKS
ncbi:MAG: DNA (cytosine-5-)-methyltransferase, partial [Actinobacteria bacterium]|nr:DNA (cytosine-5-)-methyltransferase [Actinomycetota bacterium]